MVQTLVLYRNDSLGGLSLCYVADSYPPAGVLTAASLQHPLYTTVGCTVGLGSLVLCVKYEPLSPSKGSICAEGLRSCGFVRPVLRPTSFPQYARES